jgi:hypothetical protein
MKRALLALLLALGPMLRADCGNVPLDLQLEDPACHDDAWDRLFNSDEWESRPEIWSRVACIAGDAASPRHDRENAMMLFAVSKRTDDVQDLLQTLVGGSDPELADAAAAAMLYSIETNFDELTPYLKSEHRALRERAAMSLAMREPEAAAIVLAIAKDESRSPLVRGPAIEALGIGPENVPALLELLDRRYWFFGAPAEHFPVHSLGHVILQLGLSNDPAVLEPLERMRTEIVDIPFDQRDYVEWVLDFSLERMRGQAGEPVLHQP